MNKPKYVRGAERTHAIADLKAELAASADGPDKMLSPHKVVEQMLAGDIVGDQWFVYQKLFSVVYAPSDMFNEEHDLDALYPTAGDPDYLRTPDGKLYDEQIIKFQRSKLDRARRTQLKASKAVDRSPNNPVVSPLSPTELRELSREIRIERERRSEKNTAAFNRLRDKFINDPSSISLQEAELIEIVRGVTATTHQRLELLATFPEVDAIEDMRSTCPLDYEAYLAATAKYRERLIALPKTSDRFIVRIIPEEEQEVRTRQPTGNLTDNVHPSKKVIADIFDTETGLSFEAVEKLNEFSFDEERAFEGVTPCIKEGKNYQPVYVQTYLRLKRERPSRSTIIAKEHAYDVEHFPIVHGTVDPGKPKLWRVNELGKLADKLTSDKSIESADQ